MFGSPEVFQGTLFSTMVSSEIYRNLQCDPYIMKYNREWYIGPDFGFQFFFAFHVEFVHSITTVCLTDKSSSKLREE